MVSLSQSVLDLQRELAAGREAFALAAQYDSAHQHQVATTARSRVPAAAVRAAQEGHGLDVTQLLQGELDVPGGQAAGIPWTDVVWSAMQAAQPYGPSYDPALSYTPVQGPSSPSGRNNKGWIAALVVLVLALTAGGIGLAMRDSSSTTDDSLVSQEKPPESPEPPANPDTTDPNGTDLNGTDPPGTNPEGTTPPEPDIATPTVAAGNDMVTFGEDGGITFASPDADPQTTPVLDVYLDFMCPACAQFEGYNASFIGQAVSDGELIYRAHPVSILNNVNSEAIASTFVALAQTSAEHALDFAAEAFAAQSIAGLTSNDMEEMAEGLGVDKDVAQAAAAGEFERFILAATDTVLANPDLRADNGGFGTPSLFINGERAEIMWNEPGALADAVAAAAETMSQ